MLAIPFIFSPNYDDRPAGMPIEAIIVHAISLPPKCYGRGHVQQFFQNCLPIDADPFYQEIKDLKVSAHFFIERSGLAYQFVATDKRAWHAGQSKLNGRTAVNDFSIGIELEGCDVDSFEPEQYSALANICQNLMTLYPKICHENIVGHSDIAPGRKTDPGPGFNWDYFRQCLQS